MMDGVLRGLEKHKDNFIDDILVFSADKASHLDVLRKVFDRLQKKQVNIKRHECEIGKGMDTYLGYTFSSAGMEPENDKVESIINWVRPGTKKQLKQFLGLASYYRQYIQYFATIADRLNRLLGLEIAFTWGDEEEAVCVRLKQY